MSVLMNALSFLKVGFIGFGGGSALIPIIHKEIVAGKKIVTEDEYLKHTVIANITPGALPVKLGATCGFQTSGTAGSILSGYSVALPGVSATVAIVALFSMLGAAAIDYLNFASIGITVFIVYLLLHYSEKTVAHGNWRVNALICAGAVVLTAGKKTREVIELALGLDPHSLGTPLFSISVIHIMILSFFLIALGLRSRGKSGKLALGSTLALGYALMAGSAFGGWEYAWFVRYGLCAAFFVLAVSGGWKHKKEKKRGVIRLRRSILVTIVCFLALPVIPLVMGAITGGMPPFGKTLIFLGNILVSTITSFGGGEAYVAVADSIFVQSGYCDPEMFYTRIVPVANALPGPILVKIAAVIGFCWGLEEVSFMGGVYVAAACAMTATGVCSALALFIMNYYNALSESEFVLSLKKYILPVICGTLISTSLAMMHESMKVAGKYGVGAPETLIAIILGVAALFGLTAKRKIHDLLLLGACIGVSVAVMVALR